MKNRLAAWLLVLAMVLTLLPAQALATEGELAGEGTLESPWQIADAADLMAFAAMVNEGDSTACAVLTNHIDVTGEDWVPIGTDASPYSGAFDGGYFTIRLALTAAEDWSGSSVGIFGCLSGATVRNLRAEGTVTVEESGEECQYVGGMIGYADGKTTVESCRSAVSVHVYSAAVYAVGGIIGYVCGEPTVSHCANYGDLTGEAEENNFCFGGIVGASDSDELTMNYCYNAGAVSADGGYSYAGGLIGSSNGYDLFIKGCYSSASAVEESDGSVPGWAKPIQAIYGTEAYSDFFGFSSHAEFSAPNISIAEELDGYGEMIAEEGVTKAFFLDSAEDARTYLNSGDESEAYVAGDGGWPVLAWELKTPTVVTNPKEAAYAEAEKNFSAEKTAALNALSEGVDSYKGYNWYKERAQSVQYSDAGNEALEKIYTTARTKLYTAELPAYENLQDMTAEEIKAYAHDEIAKLMPIARQALQEMKNVPTKAQETQFAADKQNAAGKLEREYIRQVKNLNALQGDAAAIWHELNGEVLAELAGKSEALDAARAEWINALNACTNKTALDSTLQSGTDALSAILQGYTVSADSGVPDQWDGVSVAQPSGSGTKTDPYRICTATELAWFAQKVNGGSRSACAVLTADIDLNGKAWTPIGNGGVNGGYTGTFDGKNHVIHGICVETGEQNRPQGLFGTVGRAGTVQNVKAAGRILAVQSGGAGLIAGRSDGTVYNCEASAFLQNGYNVENAGTSVGNIGGIAGYVTVGYVENCRTWGLFRAYPESYYQGDRDKSVNSSRIHAIGGIVGSVSGSQEKDGCLVRYCENYLQINSFIYSDTQQTLFGYDIGGIVGFAGIAKVRECVNNASVTGGEDVGGIVGAAAPGEGNSFSAAYVENRGSVRGGSGTGSSTGAGGILGRAGGGKSSGGTTKYVGNVSVEYAYNSGSVSAEASGTNTGCAGAIVGVWLSGSVSHARSSSANDLWGVVKTTTTRNEDTAKAVSCDSPVHAGNGTEKKLSATQTLLSKLILFDAKKDGNFAVYGEQSAAYNAVIMEYVRRVEEAKDSAVADVMAEWETALAAVPTQLRAEKDTLLSDMRSYVAARIYDTDGKTSVDGLLDEAAQAIENAATVETVENLRQQYMGTENIDGKLAEIRSYPVKAAEELYNRFVFDKKYSQEDMARVVRAYEAWKGKLANAADFDEVEAVYADARSAMNALVKDLAVGETAPDMQQAAEAALALARQDVLEQLEALETEYVGKLTALAGDMDTVSDEWRTRLTDSLESGKARLHTLATPALDAITDYARLSEELTAAQKAMADIYAKYASELKALSDSAHNENAWDGSGMTQPSGTGSETDPYQIGTAAELAWLANEVNTKSNNSGDYSAVLTADIDLGYHPWTSIGFYANGNNRNYRGVFDGKGYTVSGLYVTEAHNGYAGLFGYISNSSTVIKNLTVAGEIRLENCTGALAVGGIVGECVYANLENCVSRVRVTASGFGIRNQSAVGGLAGRLNGSVTDCRFEGSIQITCQSGGAYIDGGVGGVIGDVKGGTVTKCVNDGEVVVDKGVGVGGVAGIASGAAAFSRCANSKAVSNDTGAVIGGADSRKGGTGGILGVVKSSYHAVSMEHCYNTGVVSGSYIVGGILGGESSSGNDQLTVKNCYNAGALNVGTRTDCIGSLAGYPMKGQYCEGLYVLAGSARLANGWISAQGDSITSLQMLTAEGMPEIGGMVDSIAGLNNGYPLFDWQLEKTDARQTVIAYLNEYFETYVKPSATDAQQEALRAKLEDAAEAITNADQVQDIVSAYNEMMTAMNTDTLVQAAKDAALKEMESMKQAAAEKYPEIEKELNELLLEQQEAVNRCKTGSQIQQQPDAFAAGVVDLLIADAQGAKVQALSEKLKTVQSAYAALSDAQKSMVTGYGRLHAMQTLLAQYEQNAELLKTWYEEDAKQYEYIGRKVKSLYDAAADKLGACSDKAGMDAVMNGYMADLVQALTEDVAYKPGQTSASMVEKAEQRLKNAQELYGSLTAEQKELVPQESLDALQGAQALLEVYRSGAADLQARLERDRKAYPGMTDTLETLAKQVFDAMGTCVDADGIKDALNRYDAGVKALQADKKDDTKPSGGAAEDTTGRNDSEENTSSSTETGQTEQPENTEPENTEPESTEPESTEPDEQPGKTDENGQTEKPERSFDWSVVWMAAGILGAIGIILLLWRWFAATKRNRRRDDE